MLATSIVFYSHLPCPLQSGVALETSGRSGYMCDIKFRSNFLMSHTDESEPNWNQSQQHDVERRRDQAANLLARQRDSIMSRIHSILSDKARKITDTDDVLSTTLRRVDSAILRGQLRAMTDEQFFAFVHGVIERTISEKARNSARLVQREQSSSCILKTQNEGQAQVKMLSSEDLQFIGRLLTDPIDREIVLLKGRGLSFEQIAQSMGIYPAAVRKRWSRVRLLVREAVSKDSENEIR